MKLGATKSTDGSEFECQRVGSRLIWVEGDAPDETVPAAEPEIEIPTTVRAPVPTVTLPATSSSTRVEPATTSAPTTDPAPTTVVKKYEFRIQANPPLVSAKAGQQVQIGFDVLRPGGGNEPVSFSMEVGLMSGATYSFGPNPTANGTNLYLTVPRTAPGARYVFQANAVAGSGANATTAVTTFAVDVSGGTVQPTVITPPTFAPSTFVTTTRPLGAFSLATTSMRVSRCGESTVYFTGAVPGELIRISRGNAFPVSGPSCMRWLAPSAPNQPVTVFENSYTADSSGSGTIRVGPCLAWSMSGTVAVASSRGQIVLSYQCE